MLRIRVDSSVRAEFLKSFFDNKSDAVRIPQIMIPNQIYDLGYGGWSVKARIYGSQDLYHIDYFATHRMTNSQHKRIFSDGTVLSLEQFWEFGFTVFKNDPQKTEEEKQKHIIRNRELEAILKAKGLM